MPSSREQRAAIHAALGDPGRLAIVDALTLTDRAPSDLAAMLEVATNLLTHHLDVLERAGVIERVISTGDKRRRYVRLVGNALADLAPRTATIEADTVLFVCTANSARSQLAAGLWRAITGRACESAGTHPGPRMDPGAVAVAARHGIEIATQRPQGIENVTARPDLVITVCDRAHEETNEYFPRTPRLHWSIDDPAEMKTRAAYDQAFEDVRSRITRLAERVAA